MPNPRINLLESEYQIEPNYPLDDSIIFDEYKCEFEDVYQFQILEGYIKRIPKGIEIHCKSKVFEDFFKSNSVLAEGIKKWNGLECYDNCINGNDLQYNFRNWAYNQLMPDGYANLAILRSVGLSEGVTICLKGVYSLEEVEQYKEGFAISVKKFFKDYLESFNFGMKFNFSMVSQK